MTAGRNQKEPVTKILVVDDTPDARDFLASILILKRFDVVMAVDGLDGIERARAEVPDLIITDLTMPRLPGIDMIQRLRAMPDFRDIPILAITSHGRDRAQEALRAGANRALSRPVENHLLIDAVFNLLKQVMKVASIDDAFEENPESLWTFN